MHQVSDSRVNTDAKKGHNLGHYQRDPIMKIGCPRLAKNAFAMQHLSHHSIVYTFIALLRWMHLIVIEFLKSYTYSTNYNILSIAQNISSECPMI